MKTLSLPSLPERPADSHKGMWGRVLVIAGSTRYPGAAILAAQGAGRAGAGLVELAVPEGLGALVLPAVPFAILREEAVEPSGGFDATAGSGLLEAAALADAVVLGPGLGTAEPTSRLLATLLQGISAPLVLDADGLNLLTTLGAGTLRSRSGPTILTPHPGEFARLDGGAVPAADERTTRAAHLAAHLEALVILKGQGTVVTDGELVYLEPAGNPGMATGGMGDVLSGILGALLAVIPRPAEAAALAVHLHALAGDLAALELGQEAVLPGDVIDRYGRALRGWQRGSGVPER
jgi:NAD(P)H-hydrate epimerase